MIVNIFSMKYWKIFSLLHFFFLFYAYFSYRERKRERMMARKMHGVPFHPSHLIKKKYLDSWFKLDLQNKENKFKYFCIPESYNITFITRFFFYQINPLNSQHSNMKFQRLFFTQKPVLNVDFKDIWYTNKNQARWMQLIRI